ncbi:Clp protease N-terminal domain-containing protein, partial [Streptomyces sp. NPDC049577]|uniref:Clp protease N-terminal domain-containing protein n=1 Tax=Streptomyces sp. NPDC049577 TaxID=3155153 RepID=UPI00343B6A6B
RRDAGRAGRERRRGEHRRRCPAPPECALGGGDAEALRVLGIDLEAVRGRAEEAFGPGALDGPPQPGGRHRSRARVPFTRPAKRVLEQSLREALARKDRHIGCEHVLLGITAVEEDRALTDVLRRLGTSRAALRAGLPAEPGRAA